MPKPKNQIGRPTKYNQEILKKTREYLEFYKKGKYTVPYMEELELELDINTDTIQEWIKIHEEFSDAIKAIKKLQKLRLQRISMSKQFVPAGAIFQLKVNHGMIETSRQELTGKDGKDLPTPILGGIAKDVSENDGD